MKAATRWKCWAIYAALVLCTALKFNWTDISSPTLHPGGDDHTHWADLLSSLIQITTGSMPQMCFTQSGTSPRSLCLACPASWLTTALPVTQVCPSVHACWQLMSWQVCMCIHQSIKVCKTCCQVFKWEQYLLYCTFLRLRFSICRSFFFLSWIFSHPLQPSH